MTFRITTFSIATLCHGAECVYAEGCILFIVMLNVILPDVIMLYFVLLSVVAPKMGAREKFLYMNRTRDDRTYPI